MGAKVTVVDMGWNRAVREVLLADNSNVKVGFPEKGKLKNPQNAHSKDMSDMVTVAAVHEFGAPSKNIPVRSFMRSTFDENIENIKKIQEREYGKLLAGKSTVEMSLGRIGLWFKSKVQKKIRDLKEPGLKASTVAKRRKHSDNPLVDTGQMVQSVQHEVNIKFSTKKI